MTAVERVNKAWDRIDAWYKKNAPSWELPKGATDAEIDELAKHMNLTFPEEFRVSLKRHNGIDEGQWPKSCLNSIERIKSEWDVWTDLLNGGDFDESKVDSEGVFEPKWWSAKWVPIDADGAGNGSVMDLAPGPKGKMTQILDMDHETGPSGPLYPDFPAYLEDMANKFEKGNFAVEDDYLEEVGGDDEDGEGDDDDEGDDDEDFEEDEEEEEEEPKNKKKAKK